MYVGDPLHVPLLVIVAVQLLSDTTGATLFDGALALTDWSPT
jgi:hypothetical protein